MANSAIDIPFYITSGGVPLVGAAAEMSFSSLKTVVGVDKSATSPTISEIGGGWYKFSVAYGSEPFDAGDLVGVIDADEYGVNGLTNAERFLPVEVRLDFYGLSRLVNRMSQDKITGDMFLKNDAGETILSLGITDGQSSLDREPGVAE